MPIVIVGSVSQALTEAVKLVAKMDSSVQVEYLGAGHALGQTVVGAEVMTGHSQSKPVVVWSGQLCCHALVFKSNFYLNAFFFTGNFENFLENRSFDPKSE